MEGFEAVLTEIDVFGCGWVVVWLAVAAWQWMWLSQWLCDSVTMTVCQWQCNNDNVAVWQCGSGSGWVEINQSHFYIFNQQSAFSNKKNLKKPQKFNFFT
jgi:hypothetical protein